MAVGHHNSRPESPVVAVEHHNSRPESPTKGGNARPEGTTAKALPQGSQPKQESKKQGEKMEEVEVPNEKSALVTNVHVAKDLNVSGSQTLAKDVELCSAESPEHVEYTEVPSPNKQGRKVERTESEMTQIELSQKTFSAQGPPELAEKVELMSAVNEVEDNLDVGSSNSRMQKGKNEAEEHIDDQVKQAANVSTEELPGVAQAKGMPQTMDQKVVEELSVDATTAEIKLLDQHSLETAQAPEIKKDGSKLEDVQSAQKPAQLDQEDGIIKETMVHTSEGLVEEISAEHQLLPEDAVKNEHDKDVSESAKMSALESSVEKGNDNLIQEPPLAHHEVKDDKIKAVQPLQDEANDQQSHEDTMGLAEVPALEAPLSNANEVMKEEKLQFGQSAALTIPALPPTSEAECSSESLGQVVLVDHDKKSTGPLVDEQVIATEDVTKSPDKVASTNDHLDGRAESINAEIVQKPSDATTACDGEEILVTQIPPPSKSETLEDVSEGRDQVSSRLVEGTEVDRLTVTGKEQASTAGESQEVKSVTVQKSGVDEFDLAPPNNTDVATTAQPTITIKEKGVAAVEPDKTSENAQVQKDLEVAMLKVDDLTDSEPKSQGPRAIAIEAKTEIAKETFVKTTAKINDVVKEEIAPSVQSASSTSTAPGSGEQEGSTEVVAAAETSDVIMAKGLFPDQTEVLDEQPSSSDALQFKDDSNQPSLSTADEPPNIPELIKETLFIEEKSTGPSADSCYHEKVVAETSQSVLIDSEDLRHGKLPREERIQRQSDEEASDKKRGLQFSQDTVEELVLPSVKECIDTTNVPNRDAQTLAEFSPAQEVAVANIEDQESIEHDPVTHTHSSLSAETVAKEITLDDEQVSPEEVKPIQAKGESMPMKKAKESIEMSGRSKAIEISDGTEVIGHSEAVIKKRVSEQPTRRSMTDLRAVSTEASEKAEDAEVKRPTRRKHSRQEKVAQTRDSSVNGSNEARNDEGEHVKTAKANLKPVVPKREKSPRQQQLDPAKQKKEDPAEDAPMAAPRKPRDRGHQEEVQDKPQPKPRKQKQVLGEESTEPVVIIEEPKKTELTREERNRKFQSDMVERRRRREELLLSVEKPTTSTSASSSADISAKLSAIDDGLGRYRRRKFVGREEEETEPASVQPKPVSKTESTSSTKAVKSLTGPELTGNGE